jgi:tellurite resistance protein TerC
MSVVWWVWLATIAGLAAVFAVSLVVGRRSHTIGVGEAAAWVAGYVALAVVFGLGLAAAAGGDYAGQFFAGYVTEYALSVDNLFVFALILAAFRVPRDLQGRVVLIGVAIALVLRGGLIAVGAALIAHFSWVFYVFGAVLLATAINLLRSHGRMPSEEPGPVRLLRRALPMSDDFHGQRFLVRQQGRRLVTPLFAVILALGVTDLVFALDSVPAIFGLTRHAYLVFTANAFALLGLSELYFLLDALLDRIAYLGYGLALILGFIAVKLVCEALADNSLPFVAGGDPVTWAPTLGTVTSLVVVAAILAVTVLASLLRPRRRGTA